MSKKGKLMKNIRKGKIFILSIILPFIIFDAYSFISVLLSEDDYRLIVFIIIFYIIQNLLFFLFYKGHSWVKEIFSFMITWKLIFQIINIINLVRFDFSIYGLIGSIIVLPVIIYIFWVLIISKDVELYVKSKEKVKYDLS